MQILEVKAKGRAAMNKNAARRVRAGGETPAVLYSANNNKLLLLDTKTFTRQVKTGLGGNQLYKIEIEGDSGQHMVIIKELQVHPIRQGIVHADFLEIDMAKPIRLPVPLKFVGEAEGVKVQGGVMTVSKSQLQIECLPANIPDKIEVDVSALRIGHGMHVSDVKVVEGVKILDDPEDQLVTVVEVKAVLETVATPVEGEAVAGVEGAAAPAAGGAAPAAPAAPAGKQPEKK